MRFLVSNDDGIHAPGLAALVQALAGQGEVYVVAPDGERSAASHQLTMRRALRALPVPFSHARAAFAVDGSPADCTCLGLAELVEQVDMVVSGINAGANTASDCVYSGTVAAAMEGLLHGLPALAVSLAGAKADADYAPAARVAAAMAAYLGGLGRPLMLNVNVPALPAGELCGVRLCPIDRALHYPAPLYRREADGEGARVYRFLAGHPSPQALPADRAAVRQGCISVTPLTPLWTDAAAMAALAADFAGAWGPLRPPQGWPQPAPAQPPVPTSVKEAAHVD